MYVSVFALIKHLIMHIVFSQYIIFTHSLTMSFLVTQNPDCEHTEGGHYKFFKVSTEHSSKRFP